jgi:hypothetical protein
MISTSHGSGTTAIVAFLHVFHELRRVGAEGRRQHHLDVRAVPGRKWISRISPRSITDKLISGSITLSSAARTANSCWLGAGVLALVGDAAGGFGAAGGVSSRFCRRS